MLKKIATLIITCLFAVTSLTGCTTEASIKNMIEDALEKRYEEEFVCHDTWYDNDGAYYTTSYYGLCSPKDNPDILFEVLINDEGDLWRDEYPAALSSKMLCRIFDEKISNSFKTYCTFCYNYGYLYTENNETWNRIANDEFTLEYFFLNNLKNRETNQFGLYFYVCIDNSSNDLNYEEEYEDYVNTFDALDEIGSKHGLDFDIHLEAFYVTSETYENCLAFFKEHSDVNASFYDIIEKNTPYNQPKSMITINYNNGECSINQEHYIQKRKEIDNNAR